MEINRFNIRVYFILFSDDSKSVLVADEIIKGKHYTKFPGGGLEFGEGPIDCALREAVEELGQEIEISGHFYTTDFFLPSAFRPGDQVVSIYYKAKLKDKPKFRTSTKRFDFVQNSNDEESFRWIPIDQLDVNEFELPADRRVAELLRSEYLR